MGKYSKVIATFIGLIAVLFNDVVGIKIDQQYVDKLIDVVLGGLTIYATYQVTNKA